MATSLIHILEIFVMLLCIYHSINISERWKRKLLFWPSKKNTNTTLNVQANNENQITTFIYFVFTIKKFQKHV